MDARASRSTCDETFGPSTTWPAQAPLFGRGRERERLMQLLEGARSGRGRLVLVSGEAGIGKSALVEELARSGVDAGCLVLSGHCYDLSTTPPYGPWLEIVRDSPRVDGLSSLSAILGGDVRDDEDAPRGTADLLAWALELFSELATERPLVLVLPCHPLAERHDLSSVRMILRAAAPLKENQARACMARVGCDVIQGYGLTECLAVAVGPEGSDHPYSAGVPVTNTEFRIVDAIPKSPAGKILRRVLIEREHGFIPA